MPAGQPLGGRVKLSSLSLPWLANLAYGRPLVEATGTVDWSKSAFSPTLLPPVDGQLKLSAGRLDLLGGLTLSGVGADLQFTPTSLSLANLRGRLESAETTGTLVMRNAGGLAGFSLAAFGQGIDLAKYAPALSNGEGAARLDGEIRLETSGQSYQAMIASLSGAGNVTVANAKIPGVPPAVFKPLLAAADAPTFKPQADTAATWQRLSTGAAFPIDDVTSDFTVNGGKLDLAPVDLVQNGERLTVAANLNLAALTLGGNLNLVIDPGLDHVEGADPTVTYGLSGPTSDPRLTADTAALTNYLSVRALEREQARVEKMQEGLQEKLRLRREARFYRWREATAEAEHQAAEARLEAAAAAAAAIEQRQAAERAAAEKAAAAARRQQEAAAAAKAVTRNREDGAKASRNAPSLTFDPPPTGTQNPPPPKFEALPGVKNPLDF
nr:AsmA-like C-terminal region-containing protein [Jiella flava]